MKRHRDKNTDVGKLYKHLNNHSHLVAAWKNLRDGPLPADVVKLIEDI